MARYYYNRYGIRTGRSTSSAEESAGIRLAAIVVVVLAPFYPLFVITSYAFGFLTGMAHFHDLFAGVVSIGIFLGGLYFLWSSIMIRYVYFGGTTLLLTWNTFWDRFQNADVIRALFFAFLVLAIGAAVTYASGLIPSGGFRQPKSPPFREGNEDSPDAFTFAEASSPIDQPQQAHAPRRSRSKKRVEPTFDVLAQSEKSTDTAREIERLNQLRADGHITESDFTTLTAAALRKS